MRDRARTGVDAGFSANGARPPRSIHRQALAGARHLGLGGEPFDAPSARRRPPVIAQPIVKAIFAVLPELDPYRTKSVSTPVLRKRDLIRVPGGKLQHPLLEDLPRAQDVALPRRKRRDLRAMRPAVEVLLRRRSTR